jgi:hypothetical protein
MPRKQKPNKKAFAAVRKQKCADLYLLARTLDEHGVCDVGPLHQAASDCSANYGRPDDCWGYHLDDLAFVLDTPRNTRPTTVGHEINLRLSVQLSCRCVDESHNPFEELQINFELFDSPPPSPKSYISWHFDKHIESDDPEATHELHPLFHFQHGGHKTHNYISDDIGKLLLLAAPRLPYPPLDGILAIDFVLSHFKGAVWTNLSTVAEYRRLVLQSQLQHWRPYVQLLGQAFEGEGADVGDPVFEIWPGLFSKRAGHEKLLLAAMTK